MKLQTHKLDNDVIDVLKRSTIKDNSLYLPQALDRNLYQKTNKAIELIGGKWNRSAKAHVFQESGDKIKSLWHNAIDIAEVIDKKKTYQFFQTPNGVARDMFILADPSDTDTILEPSAGHGAILNVIREELPSANITAIELDPEKCRVLERQGYTTIEGDFLDNRIEFDCIIANPPFAKKQDVTHILHMWSCLKPGGRLVSVAGAGVKTNSDKKSISLQALVQDHGQFIDLADGAFKEAGTMVRTCLVYLTKPRCI